MDWESDETIENQIKKVFGFDLDQKYDQRDDRNPINNRQILCFTIILTFSSLFISKMLSSECEIYFLYK